MKFAKTRGRRTLFNGTRVRIASYVVCRQALATAKGYVFFTLKDEEGLLNVVLKPQTYPKYRYMVRTEPLLVIEGVLQKRNGIANIMAQRANRNYFTLSGKGQEVQTNHVTWQEQLLLFYRYTLS